MSKMERVASRSATSAPGDVMVWTSDNRGWRLIRR